MTKSKTVILDYGSGNVKSVFNIFNVIADKVVISNKPQDIKNATHLVLPGVGAFGASISKIKKRIPLKILENQVLQEKKPFLGICVGMQVLADTGYEFGKHQGLGWIKGVTKKLDSKDLPLPHVGWNNIVTKQKSALTTRFESNPDFYFVHSYVLEPENKKTIVAVTDYPNPFCSIVQHRNIYGVQFHPEKSQKAGKILIENFLNIK